jgi:hypothetical protein
MPKQKSIKPMKTQEERLEIVSNLKKQINDLGIPESHEGIQAFYKALDEYSQPNLTWSVTGKVNVPEINRRIEYSLPITKDIQPLVKMSVI